MEDTVKKFSDVAGANEIATNTFKNAVDKFNRAIEWYEGKNKPQPEAPAPTPVPSVSVATNARVESQDTLTKSSEEARRLEKEQGRGSDAARKARIAEMNARDEARKKALEEVSATHHRAQELSRPIMPSAAPSTGQPTSPTGQPTSPTGQPTGQTKPSATTNDTISKLIKFQGDSLGNKAHFDSLDSDVRNNFTKMISEYGKPVQVNSAHRSHKEQQDLWDQGTPTENPNVRMRNGVPVAKPGTSKHNEGRAIDLQSSDVNNLEKKGLLSKYGFSRTPGDPQHIQMGGGSSTSAAPSATSLIPTSQTLSPGESVVPDAPAKSSKSDQFSSSDNDTSTMFSTLLSHLDDKMDIMISKLSDSNDIQYNILKTARV